MFLCGILVNCDVFLLFGSDVVNCCDVVDVGFCIKKNCYENKWVFYFVFKYNDDNYWNKNF